MGSCQTSISSCVRLLEQPQTRRWRSHAVEDSEWSELSRAGINRIRKSAAVVSLVTWISGACQHLHAGRTNSMLAVKMPCKFTPICTRRLQDTDIPLDHPRKRRGTGCGCCRCSRSGTWRQAADLRNGECAAFLGHSDSSAVLILPTKMRRLWTWRRWAAW